MPVDFRIKQGDELPAIPHQAIDYETGKIVDLTTATAVVFVWRLQTEDVANANSATAAITDATKGRMEYAWVAGDTDTEGRYYGEFKVTFPSGERTFPQKGFINFEIGKDLDS